MAINVSFNGATIFKPGAYSKIEIDLGGGFPLSPTGLVAIFGESESGTPGANETDISNNVFSPEQLPQIKQKYGSGNITDACNFLFAPGADGAIPGGAQAVYIYKTNASLRAQLALANNYGTVRALAWGTKGNKITYKNSLIPAVGASVSSSATVDLTSVYFNGPGVGTPHLADAEANTAHADAQAAFTALSALTFTTIPNILDGQSLSAGNYTFAAGDVNLAQTLPGTLTLTGSASDVFVFKTPSTLTTGAGAVPTMTLVGVLASNVYWIVGSSATINSGNAGVFQGSVIADQSITVTSGGTVNGSLIARIAAVTLSNTTVVTAQNSPLLNSAGAFGLLGASAVTGSTGAGSTVNGLVGSSPTGTVNNFPPSTMSSGAANTLDIRVNGGVDNVWTDTGPVNTRAALQASLNNAANWSLGLPAGMVFTVTGAADNTAVVNISLSGSGNFELVSGSILGSGNGKVNINASFHSASVENQAMITISNKGTLVDESVILGGNVVLMIGRLGGSNPKVTINATQILLINAAATEFAMNLADFNTISQLAQFISSSTGGNWAAVVGSTLTGQLSPAVMDKVVNMGALSSALNIFPAQIKKDAYEVAQFFAQSSNVSIVQAAGQGISGLPDAAVEQYLVGGVLGATQTADIVNALAKFEKLRVNSIVPLFSRDASADIADQLTDPASNYILDGIHQAVKTHLSIMSTTKRRSERQGYLSFKGSYVDAKTKSGNLADFRSQLVIQDIKQDDSDGKIKWFQPWAAASLLAGARGGSPAGTPMTNKFFNMSGLRHTPQPMSTPDQDIVLDFDPDVQYDDAIQSGITFWEHPQTGGFKLVVDNTTYGKDGNWVYNRANVLYASDIIAFDFRTQMENIYVGVKNTVSAAEIKSTASSILRTYLAQGLTVSTDDAKEGFKQLVVQINGNVVNISVVVKLVEGIDFILADITLQRATATA
jgi:hypothetical protein